MHIHSLSQGLSLLLVTALAALTPVLIAGELSLFHFQLGHRRL
jgi:hypothetical protein